MIELLQRLPAPSTKPLKENGEGHCLANDLPQGLLTSGYPPSDHRRPNISLAEQRKFQKHKSSQLPALVHRQSDRFYSLRSPAAITGQT